MTQTKLAVVVLAAGMGTRMTSSLPKVLHKVAGKTMLDHVLDNLDVLRPERIVVVVSPDIVAEISGATSHATVIQEKQLGTGHAAACARSALAGFHGAEGEGEVLVVCCDTPLLTAEALAAMTELRRGAAPPDLVGLAFEPANPGLYGRVVLDDSGQVLDIIEHAEADDAVRAIRLCNGGVVLGDGAVLFELLAQVSNDNAKGEYYLTDVFRLAHATGRRGCMVRTDPENILGVNSRADLAIVEAVMQTRLRARAMAGGATLIDPSTVWFSADTALGQDVTVHPNVVFAPGVNIADRVEIRSFCHLEGARVAAGAVIGPFARLRPGTEVQAGARVGNFVEVKNTVLGAGAKANHLSYLGDASVGAGANIGAGTITCNYDGFAKHRTEIGAGAFVGSNSTLIAPLTVGDGAFVGGGSTITGDVPADAMAVARAEATLRPGAAARYRAKRSRASDEDG